MSLEARLRELGITLPPPPRPVASYVPVVVSGGLAFVAGQVALEEGRPTLTGRVGADVSLQEARDAARSAALQSVAALAAELGSLDRIGRIVSVTVYVACAEGFTQQPAVADGASDLFVELMGEAGRHARAAVGVYQLPLGAPVEVSVIAEVAEVAGS